MYMSLNGHLFLEIIWHCRLFTLATFKNIHTFVLKCPPSELIQFLHMPLISVSFVGKGNNSFSPIGEVLPFSVNLLRGSFHLRRSTKSNMLFSLVFGPSAVILCLHYKAMFDISFEAQKGVT